MSDLWVLDANTGRKVNLGGLGSFDAYGNFTAEINASEVGAGSITKTKLAGGASKVSVVAGEDETSTHKITCTGMAAGDEVVAVLVQDGTTKALTAHAGTLTAAADKVTPGTEVNNAANSYIVVWNDLT